jgi:hypothetical protein
MQPGLPLFTKIRIFLPVSRVTKPTEWPDMAEGSQSVFKYDVQRSGRRTRTSLPAI